MEDKIESARVHVQLSCDGLNEFFQRARIHEGSELRDLSLLLKWEDGYLVPNMETIRNNAEAISDSIVPYKYPGQIM